MKGTNYFDLLIDLEKDYGKLNVRWIHRNWEREGDCSWLSYLAYAIMEYYPGLTKYKARKLAEVLDLEYVF